MALPNETKKGEILTSKWVNDLRGEVKRNTMVSTSGLTFSRGVGGTSLAIAPETDISAFSGVPAVIVNRTGRDLLPYLFVGVEEVTNRDGMQENVALGVDYVTRKPESEDLFGRLIMTAEEIPDGWSGNGFIASNEMITRIKYNPDGSEDNFRYATISDLGAEATSEDGFILQAIDGGGPVQVIDVEPDTSSHPEEPDWRWAVIKWGFDVAFPKFYEVISVVGDGTLKVKLADSAGDVVGEELVVYDGGM